MRAIPSWIGYAKLASPIFTGVPAAPTAAVDTNTTQLATTGFVIAQAYAKLASPTFTGTVTLPTTDAGGNLNPTAGNSFTLGSRGTGKEWISVSARTVTIGDSGAGVSLTYDGSNILAQRNVNAAQEARIYAGNGGFLANVKSVTELLTVAAAPTTVGATSIPAGAILLGVSARVTTAIPTAATFTYATTVGGTVLNTAAVSTAANSTDKGTAAGASYRAAATTITITPNLTPGAATGVVRLHYYYLDITPPTS